MPRAPSRQFSHDGIVTRTRHLRTALASVLTAAMVALTAYAVAELPVYDHLNGLALTLCTAALWLLFGLTFLVLRRVSLRPALAIIVIGSALIGGASMLAPPNTSTDSARYAWDGIVQNAGISPYRFVPVADELAPLRPAWLFSPPRTNASGELDCANPRQHLVTSQPSGTRVCTAINRASVPTIYPPTAELFFAGVRLVAGPNAEYWPLQLTGFLGSFAVTVLLIAALRRRALDPRNAALWALCPLVATEAITNAHVDLLGALLVLMASLCVSRGRPIRAGFALGAAIAVKLVPVIAAPALLRRQPVRVIAASALSFVALYVPYVLATGIAVLGYLPGYLTEEGYRTGTRFTLLAAIFPDSATLVIAAALLLVTAVFVVFRSDASSPWLGQLIMIGTTLLIVAPRYPWYALLLVPFIALTGRWEWLSVALALTIRQLIPSTTVSQIALAAAVILIIFCAAHRRNGGVFWGSAGGQAAGRKRKTKPFGQ